MNKILKHCLILVFFAFLAGQGFAQYGNEWINVTQQYYKIPIAKDGIYRLTYSDLQNAGISLASTDPRRIQIFHRGIEQRILVAGENDATFNSSDYVEFYARRNDGSNDIDLYRPASTQPHPYYNLYSDTTSYFLTVNPLPQLGQRMWSSDEINVTNIPAEFFHNSLKLDIFSTEYSTGRVYGLFSQQSFFDTGEGWTGDQLFGGQAADYILDDIINTSNASGTATIEIQVVGRTSTAHSVEFSVGPSSPSRTLATQDFINYNVVTYSSVLNWSDFSVDGKITVRVKNVGNGLLSASYIKITFPQNFNMGGSTQQVFYLTENVSNKSYIEIQNAPAGTRLFDITDSNNVGTIRTTSTTTLNAIVPSTASERRILASSNFTVPSIRKVSFRNIDPSLYDYIIVSHPVLMKPSGEYANPVKSYAAYRASSAGGSYDTLVVDIGQLYNQFNYGEISPLAISRFMSYMVNNGTPRYLFIIGKGLDINLDMNLKEGGYYRNPSAFTRPDLVPSAGMPASDILFTSGLGGTNFEPAVPTGRISASTPQDVAAYLNKVKEMEILPYDELWRKEILHLSGGINPGEPETFKSYMEDFAAIAEDFYLGGKVSAIPKNTTDIVFLNISDKVNSGVNLVTLLGHSQSDQNDVNIGFVSAPELGYHNAGKYPMFLANGCKGGDFFNTETRYGEDWINTPSKGAVGFIANTSYGAVEILKDYSTMFYNVAYGDSVFIQRGIGDIQKEVVKRLTEWSSIVPYVTQAQQMFLLGDPAVKLFGASKPDYEINDNYVYPEAFTNDPITALSDSFALKIIVRNFGLAKKDSIMVRVERTLNDNTTISYDSIFYPVLYNDTLAFTIYKEDKGFGNNAFLVTLDPLNEISEIDKSNNTASLNMFIPLNAARNLFPQGFSIVNIPTVKLVVQSTDVLGQARDFVIQIDTVDTFESSYMQEFTVNGKIATQEIDLGSPTDTLAFYWRTRLAQKLDESESDGWSTASFTYIENGPEGWAQVHFPQYLGNETSGLVKDSEARLLRLEETVTNVSILTFGDNHPASYTAVSVKLNQSEYNPVSFPELQCRDNTLNLLAFDKTSTVPYVAIPVQYPDKRACGRRPEVITSFLVNELEIGDGKDLIQYIDNVPLGDSVVLFSIGNPGYSSWSVNVLNKLAELGISSAQITSLQIGEPVIILAKKGSGSGSATLIRASTLPVNEQALEHDGTITGRSVAGTMTSSVIGPALDWQSVSTKVAISEVPVTDQFSFDIIGSTLLGEKTVLKTGLTGLSEDISDIDALQYPYVQLVFHASDEINLTSPQLKKWVVEYTHAPEGVITFAGPIDKQSLKEGESWIGTYGFYNISEKEFSDSLTVEYTTYNTTSRTSETLTKKIKAPLPDQETAFDVVINTKEKAGLNDVKVFVNARILPEVYYDNNVLELKDHLDVTPDSFNPVLDVTIDGRHVMNGDYVSPNPSIVIKLWDENSLLLKTDTTGIYVFLKNPCNEEDCIFSAIYFTRPDVQWQSASSTNDFTIDFEPQNLVEGLYTLRVEAHDVRNNTSGSEPYEITFKVTDDNTVMLQRPYPNPSSSIFYFDVVVTGDVQPDAFSLEIINSNGQTVSNNVSTGFFTGTNTFAWSAQNLPNGLFFYRLAVLREGKIIKTTNGKVMLNK